MCRRSGTARRIFAAFGALFALFGASSLLALAGLNEMHEALHEAKDREADVRVALTLARAVRDQYAHQAHTVILGNTSHLGMYERATESVLASVAAAAGRARSADERRDLEALAHVSRAMDALFREKVVPSVVEGDWAAIRASHSALLDLVDQAERQADHIADRCETRIVASDAHASTVQHDAFRWLVIITLVASAFSLFLGVYIARSIASPLAALGAGAARLAAGDLSARIRIERDDEFGQLASQFNAMTAAIAEHQAKIVQSEKLAGLGRLAAGVAHELNNPLGVILGYTRLLGRRLEGQARDDLRIIDDEAKRCQFIVEGLLDLARPIRVDDTIVDLRALCLDTVARLQESGAADGVAFEVHGQARVRGSEHRLRQVVLNLAGNGARAAAAGGRVDLSLTQGPSEVAMVVRDSGPGVPAELQGRLFEPFFTTRADGTGLGLAVSRAIARAHGGDLSFVSGTTPGATFALHLPAAPEVA